MRVAVAIVLVVTPALATDAGAAKPSARPAILPAWAGAHTHFGWSGAWLFPVGDAYELGRPGSDGSHAFRINRCIGGPEEGGKRHEGADLSSGRGGDLVRAASHGLVVRAESYGWHGGFGRHIVIAHRFPDGGLAYSVYAHLADQSLRVRKGQLVAAGQPIARVGRSGRASSPHLHFEVRLANGGDEPWQNADVQDPVDFVLERLPEGDDTSAAAPYLEWARCAALLGSASHGDSALDRATWWRMLAHTAKQPRDGIPAALDSLCEILVSAGVLAAEPSAPAPPALTWSEMTRDLRRLRKTGVMVARPPITPAVHRARSERRFGVPRPTKSLDALAERKKAPLIGDACMAIADLSSTWETPKKKPAPKPAAPDSTATTPAKAPGGMRAGREVDAGTR